MDCLFCRIAAGEIPSAKVFESERVFAFRDIAPQAPVHILVIPRTHIPSADDITQENAADLAAVWQAIPQIAKEAGLDNGYRVVNNCGEDGCQSVKHLHFHILGGRKLPAEMA